ncbi:hypothetical protein NPIL_672011 [Nephila pilipes]|uniref:Uncharacterized protein n=1 Tax=Nephila pilipes TaxID=299642 RepID=A0A8X6TP96_NEPPI|nr:hypothetical protein NPIL_672011 [Nephila pilipes]
MVAQNVGDERDEGQTTFLTLSPEFELPSWGSKIMAPTQRGRFFSGHKDAGIMPRVPFRTGTGIFELLPNIRPTP